EAGGHGSDDAARQLRGAVRALQVLEEDGELVAAEAGQGVGLPGAGAEPLGHADEELVSGAVAEAVVDGLEVVEVQEHDADEPARPGLAVEGVVEAILEEGPVGEPGERVVEGLVVEPLLERLTLADVL